MKPALLLFTGLVILLSSCGEKKTAIPAGPSKETLHHLQVLRDATDAEFPHFVSLRLQATLEHLPLEQLPPLLNSLLLSDKPVARDVALFQHLLVTLSVYRSDLAELWIRNHILPSRHQAALMASLSVLAIKAPEAVLSIADTFQEVFLRQHAWRSVAEEHPSSALDALQRRTVADPDWEDEDVWRELINHASHTHPKQVADWMTRQPNARELLSKWRFNVISAWTMLNAPEALDWVLDPDHQSVLSFDDWLKEAVSVPVLRTDWMQEMFPRVPPGPHRAKLVATTARMLAQKDAKKAEQWVASLPSSADQAAGKRGFDEQAQEGLPNDLILPAEGDGIVRYVEARIVLGHEATFAWAAKLDAVGLRHRALHAAARLWACKDRLAVDKAIAELTNETDRRAADAGLQGVVRRH
jgi:hypothetical protein